MKKLIVIAVSLLTLSACSKSGSSSSTSALNSTETSLLGTWYLQSEYSNVTYYSGTNIVAGAGTTIGYSNAYYITFMSNDYPPGTTTIGLQYTGSCIPSVGVPTPPGGTPGSGPGYWYYNTTNNYLVIGGEQYIMSLSGSNLTITYIGSGDTSISTFHK